jgi:hypothetical protein
MLQLWRSRRGRSCLTALDRVDSDKCLRCFLKSLAASRQSWRPARHLPRGLPATGRANDQGH